MNEREQPEQWIGRTAERRICVTADMIDQFGALSGDPSPIHVKDEAARALN
jgi:acyl dehydratase